MGAQVLKTAYLFLFIPVWLCLYVCDSDCDRVSDICYYLLLIMKVQSGVMRTHFILNLLGLKNSN